MKPNSVSPVHPPSAPLCRRTAVFDHSHGQANWAQTGFDPRLMDRNLLGLADNLHGADWDCVATGSRSLLDCLPQASLLVIPPPTGIYVAKAERWRGCASSLFTVAEIEAVLGFVHAGGRLLAFSYRFGDSFTQTNSRDLFAPLGCLLNHDAVINLRRLRAAHPLQNYFETPVDSLPQRWAHPGVNMVRWRSMATFTILAGAQAQPLALSPGGGCIAFDRTQRRISFEPLPIAVAGFHGRGRFALFGGPHAFEVGTFGLLGEAGNGNFLRNVLRWLLTDEPVGQGLNAVPDANDLDWRPRSLPSAIRELAHVEGKGAGGNTIRRVERLLRRTGILKALAIARWMP